MILTLKHFPKLDLLGKASLLAGDNEIDDRIWEQVRYTHFAIWALREGVLSVSDSGDGEVTAPQRDAEAAAPGLPKRRGRPPKVRPNGSDT